jgi:hypothetical protein
VRYQGQRRSGVVGDEFDGPLQPLPALGGVAVLIPELDQRPGQPQADADPLGVGLGGPGLQRPGQGGLQVAVLGFQPIQGG